MSAIQERLIAAFRIEYRDHLQTVRALLGELAAAGYDSSGFNFAEAYRRVHSLKGAARAVGLGAIEALSHRLETLMAQCQSGGRPLDRATVAVIHAAFDDIEDSVARWSGGAEIPPLQSQTGVEELLAGSTAVAPAPAPVAAPYESMMSRAPAGEAARVDAGSLDVLLRRAGELVATSRQYELEQSDLRALERIVDQLEHNLIKPDAFNRSAVDDAAAANAVRALLDRAKNQVKGMRYRQWNAGWRRDRLSRQLFRDVRALRIVPAETVLGDMDRTARDAARQLGKQVFVTIRGGDTRADRDVLQALKDPIMHLLRNAVAHGIELPEQRMRNGKASEGRVTIHISTQRSHLLVSIRDDGAGLDRERIRLAAEQHGLVSGIGEFSGEAADLTRVLVRPGFSTAETISEISGRGVGLSVVDEAVRRLQGTFRLATVAPSGTEATITVPLAAIGSRVLEVRCQGEAFAIPIHAVQRLHRLPVDAAQMADGAPAVALPGSKELVPLVSLGYLLGLDRDRVSATAGGMMAVILMRSGGAVAGIVVDELVSVEDAVIHGTEDTLPGHELLAGVVSLSGGNIISVINPSAMLKAAAEVPRHLSAAPVAAPQESHAPLILVVDDSITTRTLERSILEAMGYRVKLGVDGRNALSLLVEERPDLVISDIEMPRMDGFELLYAMKNDERFSGIPVILVTSRDSDNDRRKGLTLGASAYIVKQSFDQRQLIEAVEQIL
ncbi:hybrid sensor histidine kinase/response regulator [Ferrovibrio xuzhouensis]|uniref:histidine kinase n=1 Tax=Ferrovibrio xuzhouensis TaxID=1576914 RepID=A0ABV7VGN7_9PROT